MLAISKRIKDSRRRLDFHENLGNFENLHFFIEVLFSDKDHFARVRSSRFEVLRKFDFDSDLCLFWIIFLFVCSFSTRSRLLQFIWRNAAASAVHLDKYWESCIDINSYAD